MTDGLRRRPYSVVLLDEVEKAAPEVFDLFLQVFDEGRLSDAHGAKVDARHAVFIMTSNIGTEEGAAKRSASSAAGANRITRPPEPILPPGIPQPAGRGNHVPSARAGHAEQDSRPAVERTLDRLREQKLTLVLSDEARALILKKGFDPINGARPLRRAIERLLTRPLSARIVEDAFVPGDTINAAVEGDHLQFLTAQVGA